MLNPEVKETLTNARRRMIDSDLKGRGISDPAVLAAMGHIAREEFLSESYMPKAYDNVPLPIGMGQTISQPLVVGIMTQALRLNNFCQVLEIGTGSGYQTAVLARLAKRVYTIERLAQLSESAQAVLGRLGFENVEFVTGDGSRGWPAKRTFERIIVTAAAPKVPEPLLEQLADGGILVAPVGEYPYQDLIILEKSNGQISQKAICQVQFVKLLGEHGFGQ
jgi:protein-L-isoaspartate(D-aspartate) O-methyltransferase